VEPHERGHGPLRAGQPIVIDIFPRHKVHGYWGDITRTVARGPVLPAVRRMYGAVKAAQQAALRRLKPGVSGVTVHQTVEQVLEERGFKTRVGDGVAEGFIHGTGHGVGLDIHEAPPLGKSKGRLRAGHVVTVEPGLYYPGLGGVRVEDTVVITRGGWRYLATCPKRLLV
jgi:Xaa-Pro aminopeptidase